MSNEPVIGDPKGMEFSFVECKFTVESREGLGGDWERNTDGATKEKRVNFEGFASAELYASIMDAVKKVVE